MGCWALVCYHEGRQNCDLLQLLELQSRTPLLSNARWQCAHPLLMTSDSLCSRIEAGAVTPAALPPMAAYDGAHSSLPQCQHLISQSALAQCQHLTVFVLGDAATTICAAFFLHQRSSKFAPAQCRSSCQLSASRMCVQVFSSTDAPAAGGLKAAPQAAGSKLPRLLKSKAPARGRRKVRESI